MAKRAVIGLVSNYQQAETTVAALRAATNQEPQVAGKPHPTLMNDALARGTFSTPLVVGDRLDTDIAGAKAADLPSLMVLTGVSTAEDMIRAAASDTTSTIGSISARRTIPRSTAPSADIGRW